MSGDRLVQSAPSLAGFSISWMSNSDPRVGDAGGAHEQVGAVGERRHLQLVEVSDPGGRVRCRDRAELRVLGRGQPTGATRTDDGHAAATGTWRKDAVVGVVDPEAGEGDEVVEVDRVVGVQVRDEDAAQLLERQSCLGVLRHGSAPAVHDVHAITHHQGTGDAGATDLRRRASGDAEEHDAAAVPVAQQVLGDGVGGTLGGQDGAGGGCHCRRAQAEESPAGGLCLGDDSVDAHGLSPRTGLWPASQPRSFGSVR